MYTKFGTVTEVADIITCNKYFGDRIRGVDSVGVKYFHLPLTKPVAVNTGLALRAARDPSSRLAAIDMGRKLGAVSFLGGN